MRVAKYYVIPSEDLDLYEEFSTQEPAHAIAFEQNENGTPSVVLKIISKKPKKIQEAVVVPNATSV